MADGRDLHEEIIARLKNKRVVAFGLVVASALLGVADFATGIIGISSFFFEEKAYLDVDASLVPFYLITGATVSEIRLEPVSREAAEAARAAEALAGQARKALQRDVAAETKLAIHAGRLESSQPVVIYVNLSPQAAHIQHTRPQEEVSPSAGLDLDTLARDFLYFDEENNRIAMAIRDPSGRVQSEFVEVFKTDSGFQFERDQPVKEKTIRFKPRTMTVLVDRFEGVGSAAEETAARFESALKERFSSFPEVKISPQSLAELKESAERIRSLPRGPGKEALIDQHNVDFILRGKLFLRHESAFRWF